MNHSSALLLREADGDSIRQRKNKRKHRPNNKLCPELENIGRHVADDHNNCRHCKRPMIGNVVI